jgi:EmrB/QacA subfamily drug resistance transporter
MTTGTTTTTPAPLQQGYPRRWAALGVILAAEILDLLDGTITNVAAPAIQRGLGGGPPLVQWLSAGYTLAFAVLLVTAARLGDAYGRRRLFVLGVAGFTLASAACAAAQSPGMLIAARVVQGGCAALMAPQGLGLIQGMFPPEETGRAYGLFAPVLGLSSVFGPSLGGLLAVHDWRLVFVVNLPLGALALLGGLTLFPPNARTRAREVVRLDLPGAVLVGAAALLMVYPLVQGRQAGWPLWTYASMAGSVLVLALFERQQRAVRRAGRSPLVEPSLFRRRSFNAGLAAGTSFFLAISGLLLVLSLYCQLGLGWTPLHSGLTLVPMSLGIVAGAVLAGGVLAPRYGRRTVHAGLVVAMAGVCGLVLCVRHWTSWSAAPGLLVTGLGLGMVMAPFFDLALTGLREHEHGSASGVFNALQQLAGSLGVALLGTVFFARAGTHGYPDAATWTLVLSAVSLALTFALAFLLPRRQQAQRTGAAE